MVLLKSRFHFLFMILSGITLFFIYVSLAFAAKFDRIPSAPVPGAEYIGTESCVQCHDKQAKEFERSTHAKFAVTEDELQGQGCESCHGPGSRHAETNGDKSLIVNPNKNPQACFQCHPEKNAEFRLQFHHPVLEGKMSCGDCHAPHSDEVMTWTATTLEGQNERCLKCHPEYRGPFAYEHDAMREGCTVCHNPHGSISDKLLSAGDVNICIKCHYESQWGRMGDMPHGALMGAPTLMSRGSTSCFKCHVGIHGSNFQQQFLWE